MASASSVPNKPKSAEINPGPGFRVQMSFQRLDADFMAQFAAFDSPDISDQLNRLYALTSAIHCLTGSEHRVVGPACTVKVYPGDNLMVHKSLDIVEPGDVVVVDAGASRMNAALGSLISTKAQHRGVAAFIVDGYVRDLPEIVPLDFPVFARGTTPIGPLHRGPGRDQLPHLLRRRRGQPGRHRRRRRVRRGHRAARQRGRHPRAAAGLSGEEPRVLRRREDGASSRTSGSTTCSTRPAASSRPEKATS
jgi:hypothetical protein